MRAVFFIDGARFTTLEGFYDEVEAQLLDGRSWGRDLEALDEILRGNVGPLPERFTLVWLNSAASRERLDHAETVRQLHARLDRCHPTARPAVEQQLRLAEQGKGPTAFDWLIHVIRAHENVTLVLA